MAHILRVRVNSARNLVSADSNGLSDPYVVIGLGSYQLEKKTSQKTKVIKKTLTPYWGETFELRVNSPTSERLYIQVWDWNRIGSGTRLGNVSVGLGELFKGVETDKWLTLQDVCQGEVNVVITALDFGQQQQIAQTPQPQTVSRQTSWSSGRHRTQQQQQSQQVQQYQWPSDAQQQQGHNNSGSELSGSVQQHQNHQQFLQHDQQYQHQQQPAAAQRGFDSSGSEWPAAAQQHQQPWNSQAHPPSPQWGTTASNSNYCNGYNQGTYTPPPPSPSPSPVSDRYSQTPFAPPPPPVSDLYSQQSFPPAPPLGTPYCPPLGAPYGPQTPYPPQVQGYPPGQSPMSSPTLCGSGSGINVTVKAPKKKGSGIKSFGKGLAKVAIVAGKAAAPVAKVAVESAPTVIGMA